MWGVVRGCKVGEVGKRKGRLAQPPQCNRCLQGRGNPTPWEGGRGGEIGGNNIFSTIEQGAKSEVIEIVLVEISFKV